MRIWCRMLGSAKKCAIAQNRRALRFPNNFWKNISARDAFPGEFGVCLSAYLLSKPSAILPTMRQHYSRDTSQVRFVNLSNRTVKNARKNSPGPITVDTSPMLVDKSTQLFKLTDRSDKASQEVINDWFWRAKWPVLRRFCAKYARTSFDLCCSIYVRDKGVSLD